MFFRIFIEFIKIGTFAFGGGFATLPYIFELSDKTKWFNYLEINNMITISQMTPGPLACNMATYVGYKLIGIMRCTNSNHLFYYSINIFNVYNI